MTPPHATLVFVLLGATLLSPHARAGATRPDSSSIAMAPAGYEFPSGGEQLRSWALNAFGPAAIAGDLVGASWRHWVTDEPAEWDADGPGFAKRFGTASLTTAIGETSLSLVSAAMGQDAGYYRSPRAGLGPRLLHALRMTFAARDRRGRAVFSPGKTFSPFVGPLLTQTTLYPGPRTCAGGLLSGAYGLLINAGWNAARELVLPAPAWESGRAPSR